MFVEQERFWVHHKEMHIRSSKQMKIFVEQERYWVHLIQRDAYQIQHTKSSICWTRKILSASHHIRSLHIASQRDACISELSFCCKYLGNYNATQILIIDRNKMRYISDPVVVASKCCFQVLHPSVLLCIAWVDGRHNQGWKECARCPNWAAAFCDLGEAAL